MYKQLGLVSLAVMVGTDIVGQRVCSCAVLFSVLNHKTHCINFTFPEDFIPLDRVAPTISQARSRQRAKCQTISPVSSMELDRRKATLLNKTTTEKHII